MGKMFQLVFLLFLLRFARSQPSGATGQERSICEPSSSGTDFVTEAISLDRPARIGGCHYNHVRVSSNGYITFGPEIYLRKLPNFFEAPMPLVSLYGADFDHALVCYSSTTRQSSRAFRLLSDSLPAGSPTPEYVFAALYQFAQVKSSDRNETSVMSIMVAFYWDSNGLAGVIVRTQNNSRTWSPSGQTEVIIGYSFGVRDNPTMPPVVITASPAYARYMNTAGYAANFSQFEPLTSNFSYETSRISSTAFMGFVQSAASGEALCSSSANFSHWTSFVDDNILFPYATDENPYNITGQYLEYGLDVSVTVPIPPTEFGPCPNQYVQIGSNGYIRLGTRAESLTSLSSAFAGNELMLESNPVIAVYASHMAPANGTTAFSGIFYSFHTEANDMMHERVSNRIRLYNSSISFTPTFTLVVTYHQVGLENSGESRLTAQIVIAVDSTSTFLFLNYANGSRDLSAVLSNGIPLVFVGFSGGKWAESLPTVIADLPACVKMGMYSVANGVDYMRSDIIGNTGLAGRWFYRVSRRGLCTRSRDHFVPLPFIDQIRNHGLHLRRFEFRDASVTVRKQYLPHCVDGPYPPSVRLALTGSVRFGTCSYTSAFISSFGAIALGNVTEDLLVYGSQLLYGELNYALPNPIIAPFMGIMNTDYGRTSYAQFTNESNPQVFAGFQERLTRVNETSFAPTYALVVDWSNMRSKLDNNSETISFQVLLLSDGAKTGLFFFYSPMSVGFQTTSRSPNGYRLDVGVGFTYGSMNDYTRFPAVQVLRSPSSGEQSAALNIFSVPSNTRYRGAWYWTVGTAAGECSSVPIMIPPRATTAALPQVDSILPHLNAPGNYSFTNTQCMIGSNVDDDILQVTLPFPLQIGGCNHTVAYISSNGFMMFTFRSQVIRPSVAETLGPVLAPFNADLKTAMSQSICLSHFTENDPYLNEIAQRMNIVGASPMQIKSAVVVTWYRIRTYYSGLNAPIGGPMFTFQVVLFTNGTNTNFFFTYDTLNSVWQNSPLNIGYFFGTILDPSGRASSLRPFPAPGETRNTLNMATLPGSTGVRGLYYFEPRFVSSNCIGLLPTTTVMTTYNPLDYNLLPSPQNPVGYYPATQVTARPNSRFSFGGCLENADDAMATVTLSAPLPFGGCNHTTMHISTNGYFTLSRPQQGTLSAIDSTETPCLGPFMVDLHPQGSSPVICYTMHSGDDTYLDLISRRNAQLSSPAAVTTPRFAVVVTYYRVAEYGSSSSQQRVSFQVVLFTDGTNTSFFFNYDTSGQAWLAYRNPVTVGFSYGSFLDQYSSHRVIMRYPNSTGYVAPMYFSTLFQNSGRGGVNVYNAVNFPNPDCNAMLTGQRTTSPSPSRGSTNLLPSPQTVDRSLFVQSECLPPRDDYIESVILPEPFPFGGCNHTQLHISVNGFATFVRSQPVIRPSFVSIDVPMFAPFNTDLDGRISTASVCFSVHRSNDSLLRNFTQRMFPPEGGVSFEIKMAVIATWYSIDEYSTGQRISFQLALVTNGTDTYTFFVYELLNNAWVIRSSNPVVQGITYGSALDPLGVHSTLRNLTDSTISFRGTNMEKPGVFRYANTLISPHCKTALGYVSTVRPTPATPRHFFAAPQITTTVFANSGCLPSRDDFTLGVSLLSPVPFGGCRHSTAYISTNGFLSLSRQMSAIRSVMSGNDAPVIAPLQTDLHAMREDTVCYTMHSTGDAYLSQFSLLFTNLRKPAMEIRFALVVTYYRINEYASGGTSSSEVSFQVALVTDGVDTRVLFVYDYQSAYLNLRPPIHVGYSFGSILDPYNRSSSYTDLNVMPNLINASNTLMPGIWYYEPGRAPNVENCDILVRSNASVSVPPPWMTTTQRSVISVPVVVSSRIDSRLSLSPLAVCNQVSGSQPSASVCRCRPPYVGDGRVCRGAAIDVVMFPYNLYARGSCIPTQADLMTPTILLPQGITYGGTVYSLFTLSTNGIIQFQTSSMASSIGSWPEMIADNAPRIIVYGASMLYYADLSSICFRVHTVNSSQAGIIERASQLVRNFTDDLRFTAQLVLVVTFKKMLRSIDVPFLSGRPLPAVTAQAVVISGGTHDATYVNLNYEFTDYVGYMPLRDFVTENPLQVQSDATVAGFDFPDGNSRTAILSAVDNSRLVRSGQSSILNSNAFDQLIGNTGILGSWLHRVDGPAAVDPVTRRANNPAPQSFNEVFETPREPTRGEICNETFTVYARIRLNSTVNASRDPLTALKADLGGYYDDFVQSAGGRVIVTFFNVTRFGQSDLDLAIRVGIQCIGASDPSYLKRDSVFRSMLSFTLAKHGFAAEDQVIDLKLNCWPPKTMHMISDCPIADSQSWQMQLDNQYTVEGYSTTFKRAYYEKGKTVVEFQIQGDCADPLSLTPIRLTCAKSDPGAAQVGGSSSSKGVVALAVILVVLGVVVLVAAVYVLRKKYGRIDLMGAFTVRRSGADGFEVPCNNFTSGARAE